MKSTDHIIEINKFKTKHAKKRADKMQSRNTKRNRTRSQQRNKAIKDSQS